MSEQNHHTQPLTLNRLQQGDKAIVLKVKGRDRFVRRLTEMGFVRGTVVEMMKSAPFNDPVNYRILDSEVSIRRQDAALVEVMPYSEDAKSNIGFGYSGTKDSDDCFCVSDFNKRRDVLQNKIIDIALVGNPNTGKTSLFNALSGYKEKVGNYSGVTVDIKQATFHYKGYTFHLTDLPGTYSLDSYSQDEDIVSAYIGEKVPDLVINIVDAANLERNLFLTTQLIDMDVRMLIALNMYDDLTARGDTFDYQLFGSMVGVPVVPTVASKKQGINELLDTAIAVFCHQNDIVRHVHINYGEQIEENLDLLARKIHSSASYTESVAARYYAIRLLERDKRIIDELETWQDHDDLHEVADIAIKKIEQTYKTDCQTVITNARYGFIAGALKETFQYNAENRKQKPRTLTQKLDNIFLNSWLAYPIFAFIIWLMFFCTFKVGQYPMDWLQKGVEWLSSYIENLLPSGWFADLLTQGVISGVGGVVVFLPNILILFFFVSLMEQTGYMSRVAFLMDRLMHKLGLHGKSFVPMIMGFGCNVPAIMATRTLDSRKDRLLTMMILPFMSCSARMPVYILLVGTFFPDNSVLVICLLYLLGVLLSIFFAIIFNKTLFRRKESPFVMEQPPYRIPTTMSLLRNILTRASQYLKKMGGIILLASVIVWALMYFPQRNTENIHSSYIAKIGKTIEPVLSPLGFDWRSSVAVLTGISAKELIVSTMSVLYNDDSPQPNEPSLSPVPHASNQPPVSADENRSLGQRLQTSTYQDGIRAGQKVFTLPSVISLLIFIAVYFPCLSVFVVVGKESRWKWAVFLAVYTTLTAWVLAFLSYNLVSLIV
ncbi:MAG: ferrous iron transport protein B [Bacteroidales bacterium]|jgi:ferrous iron transport protein B|nr:ferrous iron transport protein B [Bacteroidales bacterium]